MVEQGIRKGISHAIYRYENNNNNKNMEDWYKIQQLSYPNYWEVNNSYGWAMSQKMSVI